MAVRDHGDALDFDLFDRWRVRLSDVPSTIGWGAVALFLRHLPYDSETAREINPALQWSREMQMLANIHDMLGQLFAEDYKRPPRPGDVPKYKDAQEVDASDYDKLLARFRGGAGNG